VGAGGDGDPLAGARQARLPDGIVADAVQHGARVVNEAGGRVQESFFSPAIVYPVDGRMRLYREEQFGPVIPVGPFDDLETPIRYIVESDYGQQVSLFGGGRGSSLPAFIDPLVNQVLPCQSEQPSVSAARIYSPLPAGRIPRWGPFPSPMPCVPFPSDHGGAKEGDLNKSSSTG